MPLTVVAEFLLLAALWGGSFLFMRLCGAEFGPAPLAFVRALGATVLLLPLLARTGEFGALRRHAHAIGWLGITNSALPFLGFAAASLVLTVGLLSVFNATTAIWSALIAWAWLGERLDRARVAGVVIALGGVLWVMGDKAGLRSDAHGLGPLLGIGLALLATVMYGYSAAYAKRRLVGVPPMAIAAGSQVSAAAALALPALWFWPAVPPSSSAWSAALALAFFCTGAAYVLFFRLIAKLGATRAVSVTFVIPAFGVLWGAVFLHEPFGPRLAAGCVVILLGTSLTTGLWRPGQKG